MQNFVLVLGAILTVATILSTSVGLTFLLLDRRVKRLHGRVEQTVQEKSLALQEMELALGELGRMNRRIAEELDECLRAKAALQACKDG